MCPKDHGFAHEASVTVLLYRRSGPRREWGSGLPDAFMRLRWTPEDWARFVRTRGYERTSELVATCLDGRGVRWLVRCVPALTGDALAAWAAASADGCPGCHPEAEARGCAA